MTTKKRSLSKIRELYCIDCYELLTLNLTERRGDSPVKCPECKARFSLENGKKFLKSISKIYEGLCPNCSVELEFEIEDRMPGTKINCPTCKESFYIDEVDIPNTNQILGTKDDSSNKIFHEIRYFLPDVIKDTSQGETSYYVKEDKFNKGIFLTSFWISNIVLALLITSINIDSISTGTEALIYFIGYMFALLIPTVIFAYILGNTVKPDRIISQKEIIEYRKRYAKEKND